jgi:D-alanine transaminase/branched-chain amino acid aminotransferase
VFDFFRVLNGVPVFLEHHIQRLIRSASDIGIEMPWSVEEISSMVTDLIKANKAVNAGFRIVVTGGYAEDGYNPTTPNIYMLLHTLPDYGPEIYKTGARIISDKYERDMASAKTTMYAYVISMRDRLQQERAAEVLYYDDTGISECSRSNIFFVDHAGTIHTPAKGMLRGITRQHVIELARENFQLVERDIQFNEIPGFREVFITSSTKGVLPIVEIDDLKIADGKVGPVSSRMHQLFEEMVAGVVRDW